MLDPDIAALMCDSTKPCVVREDALSVSSHSHCMLVVIVAVSDLVGCLEQASGAQCQVPGTCLMVYQYKRVFFF